MTDTSTSTNTRGGARTRPDYTPKLVEELPPKNVFNRTGPRPNHKFLEGLQLAVANPGTWAELGHYFSANGAQNMDKDVDDGKYNDFIPSGEWSFDWRKVTPWEGPLVDDNGKQVKWSIFYGKYLGNGDADEG